MDWGLGCACFERRRLNVSLPPKLEALIDKQVKSGLYTSASEVVREALRLRQERDQMLAFS